MVQSMMVNEAKLLAAFRVPSGKRFDLDKIDPRWAGRKELRLLGTDNIKAGARALLEENVREVAEAQALLYASGTHAVLLILQGMDASGKDGTIKHVFSGVNPQGCEVYSFKRPTDDELAHTFLWRCTKCLPARGRIGIFNRSYYEEVVVVRVHPGFLERQRLPPGKRGRSFWQARYADINAFEQHLVQNGTIVVKVFLHISKAEQRRRLLARIDDAAKNWKFEPQDVAERAHWDDYMMAYEAALRATSTAWAPWYVIPADHKYLARALVASLLATTIQGLGVEMPRLSEAQEEALAKARRQLVAAKA